MTDEGKTEASEEVPAKPRFRIKKPNPIVYFILGPFILTFVSLYLLFKLDSQNISRDAYIYHAPELADYQNV